MSGLAFLDARSWLDEDGRHVWTEHDCLNGREATMLPWPAWHVEGDKVWPSVNCGACGAHYYARAVP